MNELIIKDRFKNALPPLSIDEYKLLEGSIIKNGCIHQIVVWDNIIIDGHNRYKICQKNNTPFQTTNKDFANEDEAELWLRTFAGGRRNLNDYCSIDNAKKLYALELKLKGKENQSKAGGDKTIALPSKVDKSAEPVDTRKEIAKKADVSVRKVAEYDVIQKYATENKKEALIKGTTTPHKEYIIIKRQLDREEAVKKIPSLPTDKYRVIYADPPWKYAITNDENEWATGATSHYPTMELKDICALPVKEWTEKDAVLFIWTTSPKLFEVKNVIDAWGFTYKASFIWDKVKHNMGHYNSVRHEFLLIATKGSCAPDNKKLIDSVQSIERTEHSVKPEEFRNIIDELYINGKKLEMFARKKVDGWDIYGNSI